MSYWLIRWISFYSQTQSRFRRIAPFQHIPVSGSLFMLALRGEVGGRSQCRSMSTQLCWTKRLTLLARLLQILQHFYIHIPISHTNLGITMNPAREFFVIQDTVVLGTSSQHHGLSLFPPPSADQKDPRRWPRWVKVVLSWPCQLSTFALILRELVSL